MDHRAYPKMSARADHIVAPDGQWVATEKIHGAHLTVATDGRTHAVGNRKRWLELAEPFFGWQLLRNDLVAAACAIRQSLAFDGCVRLFGEIFGGKYPHPRVAEAAGASAVQTGVWYAPTVRFALFDVAVETGGEAPELLAHAEVARLAEATGVFVAPLIARGSRANVDSLPVRFPSKVSALLGLPPIDGNFAEGIVLKPDARAPFYERVVRKKKLPEFEEARFDESVPFDRNALLDLAALLKIATTLVNAPRIAAARSKVGVDPRLVLEEAVLDALVDLEAAFPTAVRSLDGSDEAELRRRLSDLAQVHL